MVVGFEVGEYSLSGALEYHTLILFLKGTTMKYKFILVSPWLLKSPVSSRETDWKGLCSDLPVSHPGWVKVPKLPVP